MSDSKQSVLITGANGFVGSRLYRIFLSEGFHVIASVRQKADLALLEGLDVEYRFGDVTKKESLPELVAGVDYLIHNAGVVKAKKAETFFNVNETGTRLLLEAVLEHNRSVKKVIYISSLAAAGPVIEGRPVREDDPPNPITTYGQSKLAGEKVALSFKDKLNLAVIRPMGVYGPGDKEIFSFFQTVNNGIRPYIGDISRKLQLVHVDDLCLGVLKAIKADTKSGAIYFIAESQSYTMRELVELLIKGCGRKRAFPLKVPAPLFRVIAAISGLVLKLVGAIPMLTTEKANELLSSWEVSTSKAKDEIGFESRIPFERGAKETYDWYFEQGWLKK